MKKQKLLQKALTSPNNFPFGDMAAPVEAFGFRLSRTGGSHHIYVRPGVAELVNLQNVRGKAKPYQIRQFLSLVERYNLELEED
jgi:hypothetical protein